MLRIEDTDRKRSHSQYDEAVHEDLHWLGLIWREGPDTDNSAQGSYRQSARGEIYQRYYETLIQRDFVYPCFCSARELEAARRAQVAIGRPPRYPGTCAHLSKNDVERKRAGGLSSSLRFRVPAGESIEFQDFVRGPQRFQGAEIGDFVIRRSDGTPAFLFSNALDDALMQITHVLRGEDHLSNTPRQLLVLNALGYEAPAYGHVALLVTGDGAPLSKRRGAPSLRELRADGYMPQAINNYLARLGHVYAQTGLLSQEALIDGFDLSRLSRASARFDSSQLRYWQKEAVMHTSDHDLWVWMVHRADVGTGRIADLVPEGARIEFVHAVRDNIELPAEGLMLAGKLFRNFLEVSPQAQASIRKAGCGFFEVALAQLPPSADDFKSYARSVGKAVGVKGKDLFMPLRAALTGETYGPEMTRLFPLIGIDRARARLGSARKLAAD